MTEIWKHRQFPITVEIGDQTATVHVRTDKRGTTESETIQCHVTANSFQFGHRRAEATLRSREQLDLLKLLLTIGGFVPVTPEAAKGAAA